MKRIQVSGILLILLGIPAFLFGGFILGWPLVGSGLLMYVMFGGKKKVVQVEPEEEEIKE